jgi:hypothetical protein
MSCCYPVVYVKSFTGSGTGVMLLDGTPEDAIEDRPFATRFYNFNMVITVPFSFRNTDAIQLTDNSSTNVYALIDRAGKPILGEQLRMYAGNRRALSCRFDSVTNTITVLGCVTPTGYYVTSWVAYCESKAEGKTITDPMQTEPIVIEADGEAASAGTTSTT